MKKRSKKYIAPEEDPWSSFPDFTEDLYHYLVIPKKELIKDSSDERVKQMLLIIVGTMGIGKTKLVENMIHELQTRYAKQGLETNAVLTRVSTEVLLEHCFRGNPNKGWDARKPVQIIVFDDATSVKLSLADQQRLCALRHRMMEETGLKEGIIYSILITHDWYRLDPNFRRNALITCFLSVPPLDRFAQREYKKFIEEDGTDFLLERLAKAIKFDKEKGKGLVELPFNPALGEEKIGTITWKENVYPEYIEIFELKSGKLLFRKKNKKVFHEGNVRKNDS